MLHSGKIGAFNERISTQDCELACVGRNSLYYDIWHRDIRTKSSQAVEHLFTLVNPGRASWIFFNCMKLFNPNWVSKRWWSAVLSEYCSNRWPTAFVHQQADFRDRKSNFLTIRWEFGFQFFSNSLKFVGYAYQNGRFRVESLVIRIVFMKRFASFSVSRGYSKAFRNVKKLIFGVQNLITGNWFEFSITPNFGIEMISKAIQFELSKFKSGQKSKKISEFNLLIRTW